MSCSSPVVALIALFVLAACATDAAAAPEAAAWRAWASEVQQRIERDFALPAAGLYADEHVRGQGPTARPAWNWGAGVQLSSLVAAAREEPARYRPVLERCLKAVRGYWVVYLDIGAFAVEPDPRSTDRYYDDNAWMGLALTEAYQVLGDRDLLRQAEETAKFVFSGEDERLGGGIYWREREKASKNTCSNGPAVVLALRLHSLTGRREHLDRAMRLYAWTNAHLQDTDGLYWDNVGIDGRIGDHKWTYNTALMLRANVDLGLEKGGAVYLDEARRLGRAAIARWVDGQTGAFRDDGAFAHLLAEALLALGAADPEGPWRSTVARALTHLHDKVPDAEGRYPKRWHEPAREPLARAGLLEQASVARAFWMAAGAAREAGEHSPK